MTAAPSVEIADGGIDALARLLDLRDGYTAFHAERAAALATTVGERLGVPEAESGPLRAAARLHDIGKVGVPDRILHKPERLEPDEWAIVRCHPVWGAEVLAGLPGLEEAATIVRFHHERWSGGGYPDGLSEDDIPLASRIIGACEAYSSMTADRPFRSALSPSRAKETLRASAGSHFDPQVVDALIAALEDEPALGVPPSAPSVPIDDTAAPARQGLRELGPALAAVRLPALAESRTRLLALADEAQPSLGEMIGIIETDPGLAAPIVAAACRRDRRVRSVADAARLLGPAALADVAREVPVFDFFQLVRGWRIPPERFRLHAVETQRAARRLAKVLDHPAAGKLALAALLHDVGKLALAAATAAYPDAVHGQAATPEQRVRAERRALVLDHASAGATLLRRWGLPEELTEIVGAHHEETAVGDAALIRLADMLAHYSAGTRVDPAVLLSVARTAGLSPRDLRAAMFDLNGPASTAGGATVHASEPSPLTPREREALTGLASGSTYTEIALRIGLSTSTLRTHLHNAYAKLGVRDRAQAVLMATERGWLEAE